MAVSPCIGSRERPTRVIQTRRTRAANIVAPIFVPHIWRDGQKGVRPGTEVAYVARGTGDNPHSSVASVDRFRPRRGEDRGHRVWSRRLGWQVLEDLELLDGTSVGWPHIGERRDCIHCWRAGKNYQPGEPAQAEQYLQNM